jgi:hypothetical protein
MRLLLLYAWSFNFSELFCADFKAAKRELSGVPLEFLVVKLMPQDFVAGIRVLDPPTKKLLKHMACSSQPAQVLAGGGCAAIEDCRDSRRIEKQNREQDSQDSRDSQYSSTSRTAGRTAGQERVTPRTRERLVLAPDLVSPATSARSLVACWWHTLPIFEYSHNMVREIRRLEEGLKFSWHNPSIYVSGHLLCTHLIK